MSGPDRAPAAPDRREQQVLDWLAEPETVDGRRALEVALDELPKVRQLRPHPWDGFVARLRPEPLGNPGTRTFALVLAVVLLAVLLAATWLTVGQQRPTLRPVVVPPVPTPSASSRLAASGAPSAGPFPLASPAYAVIFANSTGINTIVTDGSGRGQVATELTASLVSPEWAPDGASALVHEQTSSGEQVWDVDTAGSRRPLVILPCVAPCQSRTEASWSPDGTGIAFFQALGEVVDGIPATCGLGRYDAASQAISSLTSSPCGVIEERHPRFSPDGTLLAFWRSRSPGPVPSQQVEDSAIFTRDLATGRETQVTDWSIHASMLDWSPDGQWIAFIPDYWDGAADDADIWRIHPDGTGLERMTTLDTEAVQVLRPRYTPDGRWLLFMRVTPGATPESELLAIPAGGGEPVPVLPGTSVFDFDVRG